MTHHFIPFKKHCVIPRSFHTRMNRSYCHSFLINRSMFVIYFIPQGGEILNKHSSQVFIYIFDVDIWMVHPSC